MNAEEMKEGKGKIFEDGRGNRFAGPVMPGPQYVYGRVAQGCGISLVSSFCLYCGLFLYFLAVLKISLSTLLLSVRPICATVTWNPSLFSRIRLARLKTFDSIFIFV